MMKPGVDYGVEVLTAYEFRRVGQVFYPPGILRDHLVKRGMVRRLTGPPEVEAAPVVEATPASVTDKDKPEQLALDQPSRPTGRRAR